MPIKKVFKLPTLCHGDNSIINDFLPCLAPMPSSPIKHHGKNKVITDFSTPKPDEFKLLGETIHLAEFGKKLETKKTEVEEEKENEKKDADGNSVKSLIQANVDSR